MIKAVIFDFFGVLVTEGFRLFCDTYFPDDKQKRSKALELVNKHDSGIISKEDYTVGLTSLAGVSKDEVEKHMEGNEPNKQLLDYIRTKLKPRLKISVLSNSGDDYINQMLDPSDVAVFDDIILSYQHGMTKPDKEIFDFAADRLAVEPKNCIFVDDSPNHTAAAARIGMKAILYEDFGQFKRQIEEVLAANTND